MSLKYPAPFIFPPPSGKHASSLIFLHGLGDTAEGWADVAQFEFARSLPDTKVVLPTAPVRPITVNGGYEMTGWFDLLSFNKINVEEDEQGLRDSMRYIEGLVESEVSAGIPSSKIVIGGFSQGGAMSVLMLRSKHKFAGILALSGYLPLSQGPEPIVSTVNAATPVLMLHGDADPTVLYKFGHESFLLLKAAGAQIELKTYAGLGHSINPSELSDMTEYLRSILNT